ncbi:hypothetical protein KC19_10G034900 [Ceratodon purpureus]|uniref:Bacterial Ig-like domain-containing protein n=2 Tax=Ceratodon purpureus TaxID=3225 RepID=A0A8T0GJ02_CERPU|nr:hypothetical protein KC19_10G034900 [Ceratodon purpureus]
MGFRCKNVLDDECKDDGRCHRTMTVRSLGMCTCKVTNVCWCFAVAALLLGAVSVQGERELGLKILYSETPLNITSKTNAVFAFNVVGGNGTNPCAVQRCSIKCKLDQMPLLDCLTMRASFDNLQDGAHIFSVSVNTLSGDLIASEFRWDIDTVAPTAVVNGGQAFTNGQNVTVNITFSEVCVGFFCTNESFCDLLVHGAGAVIPSSLKEIEKGRRYSVVVALSTEAPSGKIIAVIAEGACADAAGNLLQRTNWSSSVIRFDRTVPSVNLWTAVPSSDIIIGNQPRTCEATNRASDLRIYLDFDTPVSSSAEDLLHLLSVTNGVLTPTGRKSLGNRRFGFRLSNITNEVSEVTIVLAGNVVSNRYGTFVPQNSSTTFLYDKARPEPHLSTTSRAKTKNDILPFVVQFTESVFGFNSSGVAIAGGTLMSFKEIDKSTYTLEVKAMDNKLVSLTVLENQTSDVAGNYNLASSSMQVRHYEAPWISLVLSSLITVGLLSTALVSGALSVSSSTLAAVGAVSDRKIGDPSRNLLGLACHLQVLALSGWLAVSLPIEYQEVTSGLHWLIPHVSTPWQDRGVIETATSDFNSSSAMLQKLIRARRRLLAVDNRLDGFKYMHRGRDLGANSTLHGPALGPGDYELYFLHHISEQDAVLKSIINSNKLNGWEDFQKNMFWMGVVGGGLILSHIILVLFLKWRTRASIRGALIIPRFELYLLILSTPGLCQASAFIIRGGTPLGIVVGGLLLSVPAAFLISVLLFLIYGVFLGALVQYKEFRYEVQRHGCIQPQKPQGLVNLIAGTGYSGKWVRNNRLPPTFLPRYGLIFEDHKGPPTILVHKGAENLRHSIKRAGSTMENPHSDDESNDIVEVSDSHRILGDARASYILLDLSRRIALGLVFGLYPESDHSWSQVSIVLGVSIAQFVYLVVVKPFRRLGVQVVETISLLCEVGIFAAAMALLARRHSTDLDYGVGICMLVLLGISFAFQLVNEWYALLEQLMRLSTALEPTLKDGLKKFAGGLILPFTPRQTWAKFIGPQVLPPTPPVAVPDLHSSQKKNSTQVGSQVFPFQGKPSFLPKPLALPNPDTLAPHSREFDPESVAEITAVCVDSGPRTAVEIHAEPSPRSGRHLSRAEGRRSRGSSSREDNSQELKMLRELARASFSRHRRDGDYDSEQRLGSPSVGGPSSLLQISSPIMSPREVDDKRYVRRRRQFLGMPHARSDAESISVATSDGDGIFLQDDLLSVPEIANLVRPPIISATSDRSISKGSGHVHSHSMNLQDTSGAIRPLEDR